MAIFLANLYRSLDLDNQAELVDVAGTSDSGASTISEGSEIGPIFTHF